MERARAGGFGGRSWPLWLKWGKPGMDWGEVKGRPVVDRQELEDQSLGSMPQSLFRGFSQIVGRMLCLWFIQY